MEPRKENNLENKKLKNTFFISLLGMITLKFFSLNLVPWHRFMHSVPSTSSEALSQPLLFFLTEFTKPLS